MNIFNARLSALVLSGAFLSVQGFAVPARPTPVVFTQPDGTEVTLMPVGDESFHCFITEDGYPAERDSDGVFRLVGNDGNLTSIRVSSLQKGDEDALRMLDGISPDEAFGNLGRAALARSPYNNYKRERAAGSGRRAESRWDNSDGHDIRKFPTEGHQKVLVILVSFSDLGWTFSDSPHEDMTAMLNEPGFSEYGFTGSARDYFVKSSNGIFIPEFDVYGPVTLPEPCAFYGENLGGLTTDANPARMVLDACRILDSEVDFSQYDCDGDGVIDNVYLFYAGYGENEGAESWRIWPHAWDVRYSREPQLMLDGVLVGHYACSNEMIYPDNIMAGIGTMCHEFSHVLGLPDLYATSYTGALTPGRFSCMDQGPYNNNGRTPPLYSAYERYAVEWQKPVDITCGDEIRMLPLSAHGSTFRITVDPERPWEYFLFENRQLQDFDSWLPGHGMLVWHINFDAALWNSNTVNNDPVDQHVDLVEADGAGGDLTAEGDPFPGARGICAFTADGTPSFTDSRGKRTAFDITSVSEDADGTVVMTVGTGRGEGSMPIVESPAAAIEETGGDYFVVSAVSESTVGMNAEEVLPRMWLTVFETVYSEEDETFGSSVMPGYSFVPFEEDGKVRVEGLSPSSAYTVRVYGSDGINVSDPASLTVMTSAGGAAGSRPWLFLSGDNRLRWSAVEDASRYFLTVATRECGDDTETDPVTFAQRRVPVGWDFMGSMSNADGTFGESAPSLRMGEQDDYLWTASFSQDIKSVSMWVKASLPSMARLEFYAVCGGSCLYPVGSVMTGTEGGVITSDIFPEGVRELVMLATTGNGNEIYVDDVRLTLKGDISDAVHPDYDNREFAVTSVTLEGLDEGTEYVAWVKAVDDVAEGYPSNTVRFVAAPGAGVGFNINDSSFVGFMLADGVFSPADADTVYDIYASDGRMVGQSLEGPFSLPSRGVYIVRTASAAMKLVW